MHIALFGGSFDPPHLGHVLAATYARSVAGVDAVWILPVAKHPYAKPLTPWEQRWELCLAAFTPLGPWACVRADERDNPSGFTFDLITRLRTAHPGHRFSLIGGSDTAKDLVNWHRGAELADLINVIAIPRRGQGGDAEPAALPAISSSGIRSRLATGQEIAGLVPVGVADLIVRHDWYRI